MKVNQDTFHNFTLNSRKIRRIQEFTKQDEELVKIYTMLLENPLKTSSPIQKLLLHFPECVTHLFDEHILSINEAINRKDRIYFDLSIFNADKHQHESELSMINLLFSKRLYKVLDHPLFDLMTQLKWTKVWPVFLIGLLYQFCFMALVLTFTLMNYSQYYYDNTHKGGVNVALIVASILRIIDATFKLHGFVLKLWIRKKRCNKTYILENNSDLYEMFFIANQWASPIVALFAIGTQYTASLFQFN